MTQSSPKNLIQGISSRWERNVVRILSVRWVTWMVLVLACVSSALICLTTWRKQVERQRETLEDEATIFRNAVLERLGLYGQMLQGVRGLFVASENVTAEEFRSYVDSLELAKQYPGIIGVGFIEMVRHAEGEQPHIWPAGDRDDYMVVRYVEPLASNLPALDYDIGVDPARRAAAIQACESGEATLTSTIELVQGPGRNGALLLLPVCSADTGSRSVLGWVYAAFFTEDLVTSVRGLCAGDFDYEFFDGDLASGPNLAGSSSGSTDDNSKGRLEWSTELAVPGRTWLLSVHKPARAIRRAALMVTGLAGSGSLCMGLLIFGVLHSMATTSRRALALGSEMNAELKQAESELRLANEELRRSHAELEKTQLELIQSAKLESVGTLAAGVAHEVKNPLQIIVMGLDFLDHRIGRTEEDTSSTLDDMRDAAFRADTITKELLHFSKASEFTPARGDLESVLERSLWLMRTDLNEGRLELVRDFARDLPKVLIDEPKMQQVFINLINNALQAMEGSGTLHIATAAGRFENLFPHRNGAVPTRRIADHVVTVRVSDNGPGIPTERLSQIFDPFFTTKDVGGGSGLGLSVVKKIIDLHGAWIGIQNRPSGGLEVLLVFAAADSLSTAAPPGPVPAAEQTPSPTG